MKCAVVLFIPLLLFHCSNPIVANSGAPTVAYRTPAADEIGVAINRKVMVTFSEAIDAATFSSESFFVQDGVVTIAGTIACSRYSAVFSPARDLAPNTMFVASITTRIKGASGNPLSELQKWTFTTGPMADTVAPSINSIFPASASTGVNLDRKISVIFSEAIDSLSTTLSTFSLHQSTSVVHGTVHGAGAMATFVPAENLAPNQTYTAIVTTGIMDLTGNRVREGHSWSFTTGDAVAGQLPVTLGSASRFAVLARRVSAVGLCTVSGDVGSSPDSSISGFPPGALTGSAFPGNPVAAAAYTEVVNGCADLATRPASSAALRGNDLGGMVVTPGTYRFTSPLKIGSADVTLNAQGDPNAIFIFQTPGSLAVLPGRKVILSKGAKSSNVFWRVDSAELGTTSALKGTILADQSINIHGHATVDGRALSSGGTVSLDTCSIRLPAP